MTSCVWNFNQVSVKKKGASTCIYILSTFLRYAMIKIQHKYQHLYKSYIAFRFCSLLENEKMWSLGWEKEAKLFEFLAVLCNVCPPVKIHTLYSDFNGKSFQCWHFIRRPAVIPVTDVSSEILCDFSNLLHTSQRHSLFYSNANFKRSKSKVQEGDVGKYFK